MYTYNFKTKTQKHVFEDITHVVNNSCMNISAKKEECEVVEMFDKLHVAMPICNMPDVIILHSNGVTGRIKVQKPYGDEANFSIHNNILYLRKH